MIRRILLLFTVIAFYLLLGKDSFATHTPDELSAVCGTMEVAAYMSSTSPGAWKSGSISVSCPGTGTLACNASHGVVTGSISPGSTNAILTACDCSMTGGACLHIEGQPVAAAGSFSKTLSNGCNLTKVNSNFGPVCISNGTYGYYSIEVSCPAPSSCPAGDDFCANSDGVNAPACISTGGASLPSYNAAGDDYCYNKYGGTRGRCFGACKPAATATSTTAPAATATTAPPTATTVPGATATTAPPTATTVPGATATTAPPTATTVPGAPTATKAPTATPKAPTPTTKVPACGDTCSVKADCGGAKDGCVECLPDATGKKVCSKSPACGTPCEKTADCAGAKDFCTFCDSTKKCAKEPTPTPVQFDEAMCKCANMEYGAFSLGNPVAIRAFGIVTGSDTAYAKIPSITFTFSESTVGTGITVRETKKESATMIGDTPTLARYQADWTLNIPADLDTKKTYRVQAKPECSRKATFFTTDKRLAVLAAEDKPQSLWEKIITFFASIFGGKNDTQNLVGPAPTPTLTEAQKAQIQIGTLKPASEVVIPAEKDENNCSFIRFNFF